MRLLPALLLVLAVCAPGAEKTLLRKGWAIQSSTEVRETGVAISLPEFSTRGWYAAAMPSTVLSALVQEHVYPDPYTGMNLRTIAGTSYPISFNFSNAPMPPDSPFRHPWWFRTDFQVPADYRGKTVWLGFDGINFRANVWLNGKADRVRRSMPPAPGACSNSTSPRPPSPASRTLWPSRSSRRSPTTSPSLSSIGIRSRPTKTWASGAMCGSPPPVPSPSATRRSPRTYRRRTAPASPSAPN